MDPEKVKTELIESLKDAIAWIDRRDRGFDPMVSAGELRAQIIARGDAAIAKAEDK